MTAAAHHDLARLRGLRKFLVSFANEEELHYSLAEKDLKNMNLPILPIPFDVELFVNYFNGLVVDRPFVEIGGIVTLENLADASNRPLIRELLSTPFLDENNTTFVVLHMHEQVPHGEQILDALANANLLPRHWNDLIEGAKKAYVFYLRFIEWSYDDKALSHFANASIPS